LEGSKDKDLRGPAAWGVETPAWVRLQSLEDAQSPIRAPSEGLKGAVRSLRQRPVRIDL